MSLHTVPKEEVTTIPNLNVPTSQILSKFIGDTHAARAYPVPSEETFDDADYLPGHDLEVQLGRLIDRHETLFSHLVNSKIICLWKAKGGASKGKPILGRIVPATGLVGYFSEADFVLWLSADHLREGSASEKVVEACLFERACSLQWDAEGGKVQVVGEDFRGFTESLKFYGAWRTDLKKAGEAFEQLGLPKAERGTA